MEQELSRAEKILARIKDEETSRAGGKLKIFLGAAAGVGKTYKMLEAAQELHKNGVDVVAGVVVTHGRKDTEALLDGLEILPQADISYKGATLKEFDIDEALQRRPTLILVDELAHTNAPGSRHEKRWQDVEELLNAGINVFTTLNVQHIESVNDLVAQTTGIKVQETIPDAIFENAYEVELVDLSPDELIKRLEEGKVYVPDYAQTALQNFFKKGNLIALRELALRATADRVDAEMLRYRAQTNTEEVWPVAERILVCVGPSPLSARLVRAAKRMATRLNAAWFAVYVETPTAARLSDKERNRVIRTLALAQSLGAQTDRITASVPSEALITYARRCNVTKIVIGKPMRPRWRELLFGSVVDELIRKSGVIDVYVITGDRIITESTSGEHPARPLPWPRYAKSVAVVVLATLIARLALFQHLATVNIAMIYQLAVVVIALRYGRGPSTLAAVLSVFAFDYFFVPPYLSFAVSDTQYLITFIVMFVVAISLSTLTYTVKAQAEMFRNREKQTSALYMLTREQARTMGPENVVRISVKHIADVFDCKVMVLLIDEHSQLKIIKHEEPTFDLTTNEMGVAQWVQVNQKPAGANTSTLSGAKALYLPLLAAGHALGVIGIVPSSYQRFGNPDEMHLLETFINQMALAVERAQLGERRRTPRD